MIRRYNRISLAIGLPGIALQLVGQRLAGLKGSSAPGLILLFLGTSLLLVGLAYYAKAKGRHPGWCLMAFLSIVGLFVLTFLPDKAPPE